MARYELKDGSSRKFWDIVVTGSSFTTTYGRIGTTGRSTTKHFDTPAKAKKAAQALIGQKQSKGYVEASGTGSRAASSAAMTKKKTVAKSTTARASARKEPKASMARGPTHAFINALLSLAEQFEDLEYDEDHDQPDEVADAWNHHQDDQLPDGVAWDDNAVPRELRARLHAAVEQLVQEQPADYHPGSGKCVRDIVHPSMYPFIRGKTKLSPTAVVPEAPAAQDFDFWGRPYEDSKFQWLPTPFAVGRDGTVEIRSYINNLDRNIYPQIYDDLAELFATALPLFESVCGYAMNTKFVSESVPEHELPEERSRCKPKKSPRPMSLKGRELQVVTKIVEYDVGKTPYEGVWHVEGMSHEHIMATGVYILHRDPGLEGGDIQFKRAYTQAEAGQMFWNIAQCRSEAMNEAVARGELPTGTLATPDNRLFVFPNSHIHKLSPMRATKGSSAKRRVIVFWLVDPQTPIVSTREVWPQQAVLSRKDAEKYRLQLMKVRKLYKQSLNERAVSLCEH